MPPPPPPPPPHLTSIDWTWTSTIVWGIGSSGVGSPVVSRTLRLSGVRMYWKSSGCAVRFIGSASIGGGPWLVSAGFPEQQPPRLAGCLLSETADRSSASPTQVVSASHAIGVGYGASSPHPPWDL